MNDVSVFVDWYSFTLPCTTGGVGRDNVSEYMMNIQFQLDVHAMAPMQHLLSMDGWHEIYGRRPYTGGVKNEDMGITIYFGGQETVLFEVSGKGCQTMRAYRTPDGETYLRDTVFSTYDRASRIDFAVDIETDTRPTEFVGHGYNSRIRTTSDMRSDSGETFYVGSKKSKSKFARVYRYDTPAYAHRSHLLRIEMVAQKKHAKVHAELYAAHGLAYAAQSLSNYFQWSSPEMPKLEEHNETYNAPERKSSDATRLVWLETQVAPAIRDLVVRGVITLDELIDMIGLTPDDHVQQKLF